MAHNERALGRVLRYDWYDQGQTIIIAKIEGELPMNLFANAKQVSRKLDAIERRPVITKSPYTVAILDEALKLIEADKTSLS